ncbi:LCP family protein [Oceanobacillus senegalensis]|uniref:LCP family glycopolymer transferase n=1 Tax=Oceanobacillus senegalensis TaxID=1936063 RepID=UPI000A311425|nr:LCP family protein [Oceanobacillus senegalensis]
MNKDRLKKILLIVLTGFGVLLITTGSYAWKTFTSTITNIQEEIDYQKNQKRLENIDLEAGEPISLLLIGVDDPGEEGDPYQRSDALIYVTLNPHTETTHMVSIPRDTYTEIVGHGKKDKITHSYAFGGTKMTIRSVENFLNARVDYFVKVDLRGLEDIVDAVGGVEVNNDFKFTYHDITFEKGPIHLNGKEVKEYTVMRKDDPRGDFGRQERQRKVIKAIVEKGTTLTGLTSSISNFEEIFAAIEDNVRTNMDLEAMWNIQRNYQDSLNHIVEHEISGKGGEINKTYYFMADQEKLKKVSKELNKQLEK